MMERISLSGVSKRFKIGYMQKQSALVRILSIFSGKEPKRRIPALMNVSFKVNSGEIIGIVGANGSGKSTLLRVVAGIYGSTGKIKINGKVVSVINLNIGLQKRLTMRDNIFLCSSLYALSLREIKKRFDSIVKFSGLGNFVNTKIYQFSEGMKERLSFSIAVHCKPDILLLDEVFEVGDEDFKRKSADKINELVKGGASVLLVSHELWLVEKYCGRVIWLDKGRIKKDGSAKNVLREYQS